MVVLPEVPRNAEGRKAKAARKGEDETRGQGQHKGRSPKAPALAIYAAINR
jgi:hypothetical protein